MSDDVVDTADVSMPEGIEVDEAAAYFGVFESSDALHQMMEMSREDAFERFFSLLSDLVLKPGDFDFEEASERLNCEGGEIYFLVAGHLGVMTLPEQLSLAISEGQFSEAESLVETFAGITDEQFEALVSKLAEAPFHYKDTYTAVILKKCCMITYRVKRYFAIINHIISKSLTTIIVICPF